MARRCLPRDRVVDSALESLGSAVERPVPNESAVGRRAAAQKGVSMCPRFGEASSDESKTLGSRVLSL